MRRIARGCVRCTGGSPGFGKRFINPASGMTDGKGYSEGSRSFLKKGTKKPLLVRFRNNSPASNCHGSVIDRQKLRAPCAAVPWLRTTCALLTGASIGRA